MTEVTTSAAATATPPDRAVQPIRPWWLYAAVTLAVLVTYGRIVRHEFVSWDDRGHVTDNPNLAPSWSNLVGFWTESYFSHYVPLSYTLYMAEAWLAELPPDATGKMQFSPTVFHAGSLLLHVVCVLLVYRFLAMFVGDGVPACAGAMLFALHPLQVESVAWVSEQRGLLAALFSLIAIMAYLRFGAGVPPQGWAAVGSSSRGGLPYYFLATTAALLALLAKPSAVCVPLIALMLDVFLLKRSWRVSFWALLPWFAMAAAILIITKQEQSSELMSFVTPLWARPLIGCDALQFYLAKIVCPLNLGILYHRAPQVVLSQRWFPWTWVVPVAIAGWLVWSRNRVALAAAAWFTVVLLPVLGLMPFSYQHYSTVADRYVYLAMVAPALLLACWMARGTSPWKTSACVAALSLCGVLSFQQAGHWRDSFALYTQALRVNPHSYPAHENLVGEYFLRGDLESAQEHIDRALELNSRSARVNSYQGLLLIRRGQPKAAQNWYLKARELDPGFFPARINLGLLLMKEHRYDEALSEFEAALASAPWDVVARFNRGLALEKTGRVAEAIEQFRQVLQIEPHHPQSRLRLGILLAAQGQRGEAIEQFRHVLSQQDDPAAHAELAAVLIEQGDLQTGLEHYQQALKQPSTVWATVAGRLAWLLSTHPSPHVRDGPRAVLLAEEACRQTGYRNPELLESLAAAKAETGHFAAAVERAQQALDLSAELGDVQRVAELQAQLHCYREERPFRRGSQSR